MPIVVESWDKPNRNGTTECFETPEQGIEWAREIWYHLTARERKTAWVIAHDTDAAAQGAGDIQTVLIEFGGDE